ncbi:MULTISPECIES: ubiquinol-cytochrome C chaperone family protein [Sphingomonas]|uniref:ubiquinol-cytochrome C chaperone family protein n=1 Tax=Sphingomonas TaxID=13687 RepID=UPI001F07912E|nr:MULTISPECIES: ubiquinol-cytochrome C chaperone family protein [Sphingomonas]
MASLMRLFRRDEPIAQALYAAVVAKARTTEWYVAGEVPDTLEGRFSMLATLLALVDLRLERGAEPARMLSVSLAEAFVADMDAQHRQMGTGDPVMGKKVGGLVGALGGRIGAWRRAIDGSESWPAVTERSVFRGTAPNPDALDFVERRLRDLWAGLEASSDDSLGAGRLP